MVLSALAPRDFPAGRDSTGKKKGADRINPDGGKTGCFDFPMAMKAYKILSYIM